MFFMVQFKRRHTKARRYRISAGSEEEAKEWATHQRAQFSDKWKEAEITVEEDTRWDATPKSQEA